MRSKLNQPLKSLVLGFSIVITAIIFTVACHPPSQDSQPQIFREPASDKDGVIKILVLYDMEGLSGQKDWRTTDYSYPEYYKKGQEYLTGDVNAVIEGLFEGGAEVVHVVDGHGSGNPEPDILVDEMDSRAEMINRDASFDAYIDLTEEGAYDAIAVVGMHSKTGGGGFLAHTYTVGMDWILNERSINETEIVIYSWGRVGVPVIFASGDNTLKEQLELYPWIEFVTVKNAISADDAELMPVDEVHEEMRAAAKRAVENMTQARAVELRKPIKAALKAVHPARLSRLEDVPGIDYKDNTITFEAKDFLEAYKGIVGLIRVATDGYDQVLRDVLREKTDFRAIVTDFREKLTLRWLDVESGRWTPPTPEEKKASKQKYFGFR